jgi:carbon storage regulator
MLVLTRRCGESIVIGKEGKIRVRFLATNGKQVRIGIEAPNEVSINREEIYFKKYAKSRSLAAAVTPEIPRITATRLSEGCLRDDVNGYI